MEDGSTLAAQHPALKDELTGRKYFTLANIQGAISLNHLEGKFTPKLVYLVLKKELLNFSETASRLTPISKPISKVPFVKINILGASLLKF